MYYMIGEQPERRPSAHLGDAIGLCGDPGALQAVDARILGGDPVHIVRLRLASRFWNIHINITKI